MSESKYLTIDNLGVDPSKQYALNQQELDQYQLKDSSLVPKKTEISVITPAAPSENESKFAIGRATIWATFDPPAGASFTSGRLFTYQLIPSLGTLEQQRTLLDRLIANPPTDPALQKEHKMICTAMQELVSLEQTSEQISARRSQYQKG